MPVLVRNTESGRTVFSDPVKKISVEWAGAGDPNGEDLQQVPDEIVTGSAAFIKTLQRGILVVEEASEETKAVLDKQTSSFRARQEQAAQVASSTMDQQARNDLISVDCIGPNARGTGSCGDPVPVREKDLDAKPPLCPKHKSLEPQYVVEETEDFIVIDGKATAKKTWIRMATGPRERATA